MTRPQAPVRLRHLAALLIEYREKAGKSLDDAAERIGCHRTKINRIENARLGISLGELRDLLTFYGVTDAAQVDEMVRLAQRVREPAWIKRVLEARRSFADFLYYETTAERIRSYQSLVVAGLLQTPDYARAILGATPTTLLPDEAEAMLEGRMKRQEILSSPSAPHLCVVEGEAALRLQVGGREVMRKQLEHLETMAGHPSVEIRVVPYQTGAHAALSVRSFVMFSFASPRFPEIVTLEHRTGTQYLETPEETAEYALLYDSVLSTALSPEDSLALIGQARREM